MTDLLPTVEIGPDAPTGSVVWLHGLGASGHDFEDIVPMLERPDVRFVFPHAPTRAVTLNMGLLMPAWYDIEYLGAEGGEKEAHVRDSARLVEALLAWERERGIPSSRIVLAGFSQGAAMALHVGTRHAEALLGIVVLSGYELLAATREDEEADANATTPMLFCHGTLDPMVPVDAGRAAYTTHAEGRSAAWHEFPIAHALCVEEVEVIRDWLKDRFEGTP